MSRSFYFVSRELLISVSLQLPVYDEIVSICSVHIYFFTFYSQKERFECLTHMNACVCYLEQREPVESCLGAGFVSDF